MNKLKDHPAASRGVGAYIAIELAREKAPSGPDWSRDRVSGGGDLRQGLARLK